MASGPRLLPPPGFVPAVGVTRAWRSFDHEFAPATVAARFAKGLRYERNFRAGLAAWAAATGVEIACGPWFGFVTPTFAGIRYCQPDAILNFGQESPLVVLEAKLSFEPRAWWQLSALYRPVVEAALGRSVLLGAVCGSFDPAVRARIPASAVLTLECAGEWLAARRAADPTAGGVLPVLQWRKPGPGTLD